VLEGLRGWYREVFRRREAATTEILERDAEIGRELARTMPAEQLVERMTTGLELRREPWMRRVVLVPHIALRPWNILAADGPNSIVCYPVADESLGVDVTAPPAQLFRLHRALGDEKRLRMLKVLASRAGATLQELADAAGLAKSSAHHHLVILRSAGLVKVSTEGHGRYRLDRGVVPDAGRALGAFLGERP
jgi:DNA-binding transcriptional ArsR family regulator